MVPTDPEALQFDLFGDPIHPSPLAPLPRTHVGKPGKTASSKSDSGVHPCEQPAEVLTLGKTLHPAIFLGTSSWSYPGWQGLVYAGIYSESRLARDGLASYSQHPLLRSVGIDRTFYAPISESDYARYASQVPETFRFLVKAPMAITSAYVRNESGTFSESPHFLDAAYAVKEFITPCTQGLAGKAGPLVFQFPPQGVAATRDPDRWINRLYRFLLALPKGPLYAVEIRDAALLTQRFLLCLKTTDVIFCVASHANMPSPHEQIARMLEVMGADAFKRAFIARWSLHAGFKYADAKRRYEPFNQLIDEDVESREALAAACLTAVEAASPAFVIVNNKAEGSSPLSITRLAAAICQDPRHPC